MSETKHWFSREPHNSLLTCLELLLNQGKAWTYLSGFLFPLLGASSQFVGVWICMQPKGKPNRIPWMDGNGCMFQCKLDLHWFQEAKFTVISWGTGFGCMSWDLFFQTYLSLALGEKCLQSHMPEGADCFKSDVVNGTSISHLYIRQCHPFPNSFSNCLFFTLG